MSLFKINDRFPNYQDRFLDGHDIKGVAVYVSADGEKVGNVHDILVDEAGRIRYLVIDTGFWVLGKKVLLPIGRCSDASKGDRIYVSGLTKAQVESLPEYSDDLVIDYDYEERVRSVYRAPQQRQSTPAEMSALAEELKTTPSPSPASTVVEPALPSTAPQPSKLPIPVEDKRVKPTRAEAAGAADEHQSASYRLDSDQREADSSETYDREPDLYAMTDDRHRQLRLYEERLVAEKRREKTGEVTVTKQIVTEPVEGSVPIQKEKIIIEIESVVGATRVNMPDGSIEVGEVARADVHSDQIDVRKDTAVRQEVTIRKEVNEEIVTVRDTVRREELDVQKQGTPDVDIRDHRSS